ncbi:MAG: glycogen debranching enzyme, partial [Chloroflexota bacterium]
GDEFRRTQRGNNNGYAQDNDISWIDWSFKGDHAEIYRFAQMVIALRKKHPIFRRTTFFMGGSTAEADIRWFSEKGDEPQWSATDQTLMCLLHGGADFIGEPKSDHHVLIMFNASQETRQFSPPLSPNKAAWFKIIDTAHQGPDDIGLDIETALSDKQVHYGVQAESMVVLMTRE